ncbi:MAG: stage V sporulation protein S [Defluviitaleaceae bacterium]|nr:stage V sporulation protein S [Defluviitaleaceae bacterium]
MELLKVSSQSKPKLVAGAIAAVVRTGESVEIQAIGAAAVNQAVKSIAVARGYVVPNGIDLVSYPAFSQLEVDGEEKTSIKFVVERRNPENS